MQVSDEDDESWWEKMRRKGWKRQTPDEICNELDGLVAAWVHPGRDPLVVMTDGIIIKRELSGECSEKGNEK